MKVFWVVLCAVCYASYGYAGECRTENLETATDDFKEMSGKVQRSFWDSQKQNLKDIVCAKEPLSHTEELAIAGVRALVAHKFGFLGTAPLLSALEGVWNFCRGQHIILALGQVGVGMALWLPTLEKGHINVCKLDSLMCPDITLAYVIHMLVAGYGVLYYMSAMREKAPHIWRVGQDFLVEGFAVGLGASLTRIGGVSAVLASLGVSAAKWGGSKVASWWS